MLTKNPQARPSAEQLLDSPWFKMHLDDSIPTAQADMILKNLNSFSVQQKLQQAVFSFISNQLQNRDEIKYLGECFRRIDTNGDGKLSREELLFEYLRVMPEDEAVEKVNQIMEEVDADISGFIEYSEFVMAATKKETLLEKENLDQAFKMFDCDGSGTITADELKEILQGQIEEEQEEQVWQELIRMVDQDGNGEIDLKEFKDMMLSMF